MTRRFVQRGLGLALICALLSGCHGRSKQTPDYAGKAAPLAKKSNSAVQIDLTRGAPPEGATGGGFSLAASRNYSDLISVLSTVRSSDTVKGVFVRLGSTSFDWARSEELGRLFGDLRANKRKVVCHAHSLSNSALLLAAKGCDKIWLSPAGDVDAVGIAGQALYLKDLLDRFKVQAQFLHVGRYKSAAEVMTLPGPSDAAREAMQSVLGSIRATWLDGVSHARAQPNIGEALEDGPYDAAAAKRVGLIDDIGYESEAEADLKAQVGASEIETTFGLTKRRDAAKEILDAIATLVGVQEGQQRADHVALVVASGTIQMESGGPWSSDGIAFRPLAKTLRRLANDDSVKAVVLRLSSPGGSALASDLLWHELMDLRAKKPLIASVGDMAASGGYYMASAAQQIFAEKSSIVGSIGVVGGKIVIADALSGIGVNTATFTASPAPGSAERATYMSMLTPWDPPTIQKVQNQMNSVYQLFLQRVSQGRGIPIEAVAQVAEGRIWSGEQGLQRKLVDTFGGLDDALSRARELGKLNAEAPVILEGAGETLLDLLSLDDHAEEEQVRAALAKLRAQPSALDVLTPQFRPFVAMLQPMLEGERVLAIIPHGLVLQ